MDHALPSARVPRKGRCLESNGTCGTTVLVLDRVGAAWDPVDALSVGRAAQGVSSAQRSLRCEGGMGGEMGGAAHGAGSEAVAVASRWAKKHLCYRRST